MWTKSACVLLAWSIVLIVTAAGLKQPARPAQANTRNANSTQVITLTSALAASTPFITTAHTTAKTAVETAAKTARYVVQPGDTLSGIAARFGLPGGWRALYAANRTGIGPDPNIIRTGTVLTVPGPVVPARYSVAAGDTLSGIAARFGLPGGWRALYAANRTAIGPDPNIIRTGTVLIIPRPATARTPTTAHPEHRPHRTPPPTAHPGDHSHQPAPPTTHPGDRVHQPPPPSGGRHGGTQGLTPVRTRAPVATGMPAWLTVLLLAVGVVIGGAFLLHLIMAVGRRESRAAVRAALVQSAPVVKEPASGSPAADKACIVLADHDRLIVTRSSADDTIYVLRPPGADPAAILRVARLVLAEASYRDLAEHLGLPASWPIIEADYHRLVVTHSAADNTVYVLRPPGEDPLAVLRAARLVLQEEPYEELASQLGVPASWPLE
ncbi:LysM peptidoglycan-binding domain-containing protein [Trebonia kvetii]|nr:LysM peptidoglycan-binding domain-containing protein [Trebonia kvetii]